MIIKAGQVQSLTDARYFTSKGVALLGFCFDPESPAFVSPREAQQIKDWVEGPAIVGEFGPQPVGLIRETAMILGLDYVQLAPVAGTDYSGIVEPLIYDLTGSTDNALPEGLTAPAYILVDDTVTEAQLGALRKQAPVLVAAEALPDKLLHVTNSLQPDGVELTANPEDVIGEKAFDAYDEFFEMLQAEL